VEVQFVAYVIERNTALCYAYHSTRKCVLHTHETIASGNGRQFPGLSRRRMHGAAKRRQRKTFHVSKESSKICSCHYRTEI
jgi:hypothetical protein